jgi:hypothetical protein
MTWIALFEKLRVNDTWGDPRYETVKRISSGRNDFFLKTSHPTPAYESPYLWDELRLVLCEMWMKEDALVTTRIDGTDVGESEVPFLDRQTGQHLRLWDEISIVSRDRG